MITLFFGCTRGQSEDINGEQFSYFRQEIGYVNLLFEKSVDIMTIAAGGVDMAIKLDRYQAATGEQQEMLYQKYFSSFELESIGDTTLLRHVSEDDTYIYIVSNGKRINDDKSQWHILLEGSSGSKLIIERADNNRWYVTTAGDNFYGTSLTMYIALRDDEYILTGFGNKTITMHEVESVVDYKIEQPTPLVFTSDSVIELKKGDGGVTYSGEQPTITDGTITLNLSENFPNDSDREEANINITSATQHTITFSYNVDVECRRDNGNYIITEQ